MLVVGGVFGLLVVVATLSVVLNELRIGGQTYQEIINDKDLLADILPPPVYLIESYLTIYQILENLDPQARTALWKRIDQLKSEFQARKQFWQAQSLPAEMSEALTQAEKEAEAFFVLAEKLKHTELYSMEQTDTVTQLHKAYANHRHHVDGLVSLSNDHFSKISTQADHQLAQSIWFVSILVLLIILMAAYMGIMTLKRVTEPVDKLVRFMQEVIRTGNLGMRCTLDGRDEITTIARAFDQTLTTFQVAIEEVNRVMTAIGQGRFDQRVTAPLYGDLGLMRDGVNTSAENVAFMMQQLALVMAALEKGDFNIRMDERVAEDFRRQVDGSMGSLQSVVTDINNVMAQVAKGELNVHVAAQA